MYRCEICKKQSQPGEARHSHYAYRKLADIRGPAGSILKEIKVCGKCHVKLTTGSESYESMTAPPRARTKLPRLYRALAANS